MKTTLKSKTEHSGVVRQQPNGELKAVQGTKPRLAPEESGALVEFIRLNRERFPTKAACFSAALESTGIAGKIKSSSTAVDRYFHKAETDPGLPRQKRKYVRRQPAATQVHVNFCPHCGCNLQAVAMGLAMALNTK